MWQCGSQGDGNGEEGEVGAAEDEMTKQRKDNDDAQEHERHVEDARQTQSVRRPDHRRRLVPVEILQQLHPISQSINQSIVSYMPVHRVSLISNYPLQKMCSLNYC